MRHYNTVLVGLLLLGAGCSRDDSSRRSEARPGADTPSVAARTDVSINQYDAPQQAAPEAGQATSPLKSHAEREAREGLDSARQGHADEKHARADTPSSEATGPTHEKADLRSERLASAVERAPSSGQAIFRPRPGRRIAGEAKVHERDGDLSLLVTLRDLPQHLDRLRLYRAPDCKPFGIGAGKFTSLDKGIPDDLTSLGDMQIVRGGGRREYPLTRHAEHAISPTLLRGTALVVFAPVRAHGGEIAEPIGCAQFPSS